MSSLTVLVVDDDPKMRELLQIVLESAGFRTRAAADGEAALELVHEDLPGLVITDVVLPRKNGLELAETLRADPGTEGIPIVLVSGVHRGSLLGREAAQVGAAEFLQKPIDLEQFVETVSRILGTNSDTEGASGLKGRVDRLRQAYIRSLPERIDQLEMDWISYLKDGSPGSLQRLHRTVHGIAGTAGTLGLEQLGELAREVEDGLEDVLGDPRHFGPELKRRISVVISTLKEAFGEVPSWAGPVVSGDSTRRTAQAPLGVLLLEDEENAARRLAFGLEAFGYRIRWAGTADQAKEVLRSGPALATVVDLILGDDRAGGFNFLSGLKEEGLDPGPVVVLSARHDLEARLEALRAGALTYLTKPAAMEQVVDALDQVVGTTEEEGPFRVLVVDDDPAGARRLADVLEGAGMSAMAVDDVEQAVQKARELVPDLILVDEDLTVCSGLELAQVLRQVEPLVSVPILMMAASDEEERRVEVISAGVVGVLTKPIDPAFLVSFCRARALMGRELRRRASHDGLTGVLTHVAVLEQLRAELARCVRDGCQLTVAMIDLDGFKQLNDRLGHLTGDRVLKTVGRTLHRRLRRSDVVGRYGGDEFLAVLPGSTARQAAAVMEELRQDLAPLLEEYGEPEARVTVSIGLAEFPEFGDMARLLEAADRALYEAKENGRDQIVIAV